MAYLFHKVDKDGVTVEAFTADLAPAQLDRLLHPYQASLNSGIRLLGEVMRADADTIPIDVIRAADAFRAVLGEYTDSGADDE